MDESMRDLLTRTLRARLGFSEDSLAALASAEIERLRAELDAERAKQPKCQKCDGFGWVRESQYSYVCHACHNPECKPAPEPPKKAVYKWQFDGWNTICKRPLRAYSLLRDGIVVGRAIERVDGFHNWAVGVTPSAIDGERTTYDLAKAAVEAVVRAHYGDAV